jgi:hypothetical protein
MDAVYTWVDGAFPGYAEVLGAHARTGHDLNPNRYRDNLNALKYSLRSLQAFVPWVRRVFLVTIRPQVPAWLDTASPDLRVVHHDEFMDACDLPTFNSFAILASLHRLPEVSRRFLYVEDDYLFGAPTERSAFVAADGRLRFYADHRRARDASCRGREGLSPWTASHASANHLLDKRYGRQGRRMLRHAPLVIDVERWRETISVWPEVFASTIGSRFRAPENVPPEYLHAHHMAAESKAVMAPYRETLAVSAYHGVENLLWRERLALGWIRWRRPSFYCLNDNFDANPNPRVVSYVRGWLESQYPTPSRFERPAA